MHILNQTTNQNRNGPTFYPPPDFAAADRRKCWLESSFVGNRPLDSPQTPVIEQSFSAAAGMQQLPQRRSSDNTRINGGGKSVLV